MESNAYLMFCTLSGNIPAPKTKQNSRKQLKCNPDPAPKLALFFAFSSFQPRALIENSTVARQCKLFHISGEYYRQFCPYAVLKFVLFYSDYSVITE